VTTTTTTKSRISAVDPETGRKYVKTQTVEGATVTVTQFTGEEVAGKYRWTSALYDVTSPAGELFAGAIKWNGKSWIAGGKPAPSLTKAVRAVLGIEQLAAPKASTPKAKASADQAARPPARKRRGAEKTGHPRADQIAADSGESVIEADPDTGLPRIKPEVQAKADEIVAAQLAKNEQAARNAG
jgi:hypothetical protein